MPAKNTYAIAAALIGWISLVLQLILFVDDRTVSVAMAVVRFFTFSPILTTLLAALMFITFALAGTLAHTRLATPSAVTAITAYMTVVGIIYNTVLRGNIELHGLNAVLNEFLHVILPIVTLLFWLIFIPKNRLQWTS